MPTLARDHLPRAKPFSPSFDTREYGYTFVNYLVLAKICEGGRKGGGESRVQKAFKKSPPVKQIGGAEFSGFTPWSFTVRGKIASFL